MHTNLFVHGHSKAEVKQSLNDDQRRSSRTLKLLDFILVVCVLVLIRNEPITDAIAICAGAIAALSGMRYFVDQSVRNFYLHRLDWEEAAA